MSSRRDIGAIITAHFNKAVKEPNEYVIFTRDPEHEKGDVWFVLVRNIEGDHGEFIGGEYLFKMWVPEGFPHKPPRFEAMTPNGVYQKDKECCIDGGKWHADRYRAVLGMLGFAMNLPNGMVGWEYLIENGGINLICPPCYDKVRRAKDSNPEEYERGREEALMLLREYAYASTGYNEEHYGHILALLEEQYALYSAKWDIKEEDKARFSFRGVTL